MGNAKGKGGRWGRGAVHPHVHGERRRPPFLMIWRFGSSPRTWGTPDNARMRPCSRRFIPTYMGNAAGKEAGTPLVAVHPHVHGERLSDTVSVTVTVGSSPRTWGTPPGGGGLRHEGRFIPTYMGNARHPGYRSRRPAVPPHVHGTPAEVGARAQLDRFIPRTWGTRYWEIDFFEVARFIPTYMGNAIVEAAQLDDGTVHPHVHGERSSASTASSESPGSSPRTWGTLFATGDGEVRFTVRARFIPTYMGNAGNARRILLIPAVHPHVHGERRCVSSGTPDRGGSSPRTWGTQKRKMTTRKRSRFIPTYMGNAR